MPLAIPISKFAIGFRASIRMITPALLGFEYRVCRSRLDPRIVAELCLVKCVRSIRLLHMLRWSILPIAGILTGNQGRIIDAGKFGPTGRKD